MSVLLVNGAGLALIIAIVWWFWLTKPGRHQSEERAGKEE